MKVKGKLTNDDKSRFLISSMSMAPEFINLQAPIGKRVPILVSSPHSGRFYPEDLLNKIAISQNELRIMEDFYVDELCADSAQIGAYFLKSNFARAYIDLNRAVTSIDSKLIEGGPTSNYCPYAQAGIGLIARLVRKSIPIYRQKLPYNDIAQRIENIYRPYHETIERIISQLRDEFGLALLIDMHSMPKAALGLNQCDIIIGNANGRSANQIITERAMQFFKARGLRIRLNHLYSGGFITQNHAKMHENVHAIQIELNRALYMNEADFGKTDKFKEVKALIGDFIEYMGNNSNQSN